MGWFLSRPADQVPSFWAFSYVVHVFNGGQCHLRRLALNEAADLLPPKDDLLPMGDVRDFSLFCTVDSDLPGKGLYLRAQLITSQRQAVASCSAEGVVSSEVVHLFLNREHPLIALQRGEATKARAAVIDTMLFSPLVTSSVVKRTM